MTNGLASEWIQSVKSAVGGGLGTAEEFIRKHPVTSAVTVGGGALAGVAVTQIVRKRAKKSTKAKKSTAKKSTSKKRKTVKKKTKKKKSYYKGRTSTRTNTKRNKVYYTKKNKQPYIILANGRAKFIKKSSASRMRKTKGGYK